MDRRTKRQKLLAVIAPTSGATEGERDNARRLLERLDRSQRSGETQRVLTREEIAAQPGHSAQPDDSYAKARYTPPGSNRTYTAFVDEMVEGVGWRNVGYTKGEEWICATCSLVLPNDQELDKHYDLYHKWAET